MPELAVLVWALQPQLRIWCPPSPPSGLHTAREAVSSRSGLSRGQFFLSRSRLIKGHVLKLRFIDGHEELRFIGGHVFRIN